MSEMESEQFWSTMGRPNNQPTSDLFLGPQNSSSAEALRQSRVVSSSSSQFTFPTQTLAALRRPPLPPPPPPPQLMDELVEEVLLRSPPDDPAHLVRAALVCKRWCRILTGAGFRRRFRELHRTAPVLGFLHRPLPSSAGARCRFTPTTSFRPPDPSVGGSHALDSRHGRVLLGSLPVLGQYYSGCCLAVWDPITGEQLELPDPPLFRERCLLNWNAAVLCASSVNGACDHLDCSRGPFLVVVVGTALLRLFCYVYSSEDGAWSKSTHALQDLDAHVRLEYSEPSVLAGNAVYFISANETDPYSRILKYDLGTWKIEVIQLPPSSSSNRKSALLTATENGGLGCAIAENSRLCLWSRVPGPNRYSVWAQTRVIELKKVFPDDAHLISYHLVGFANGLDVLFVMTYDGLFSLDLKSGQMKKVCEGKGVYGIALYTSFCTPALRVMSTREEPSADASSA